MSAAHPPRSAVALRDLHKRYGGVVALAGLSCEVPRGYFGVEAEGYWIEFKNVKFKELK